MRGFLSLEPDAATGARLLAIQNRLRDALTRQGVHFPEHLGITLLSWPFGTLDEVAEAARTIGAPPVPTLRLSSLKGVPNDDRPGQIGLSASGLEALQEELFEALRVLLDPDPSKSAFVRLARVSPPSRKVGAALRGSLPIGGEEAGFTPRGFAFWTQTAQGFEIRHTIPTPVD